MYTDAPVMASTLIAMASNLIAMILCSREEKIVQRSCTVRWQMPCVMQLRPPYTAAVQQLRGICDLDLTTLQAQSRSETTYLICDCLRLL